MTYDIISAVEACYREVPDERAWLEGILSTLAPFERGCGAYAVTVDMHEQAPRTRSVAATSALPVEWKGLQSVWDAMLPHVFDTMFSPSPPAQRGSRIWCKLPDRDRQEFDAFLRRTGTVDAIGITAREHDGRMTHLGFPMPPGASPIPPRALGQLSRLAAHLLSARRLREAAGAAEPHDAGVEAVLDAAGRILDARGAATERPERERLAAATSRIERARGRLRRTGPDEALDLWEGLVDGTWSLVDQEERGGRRLLLARRNPPGVVDPKALAPRERDVLAYAVLGHSNKFIGYMLGLSPSTVAGHLSSAERKLGVASRRELIELFTARSSNP